MAVSHRGRVIEGVALGRHLSHHRGPAVLGCIVQLGHASAERIAVRLAVAAAKERHHLTFEVGRSQHLDAIVPVVLHIAGSPGRGAKDEILISGHGIGREVGHIVHVGCLNAHLIGYLTGDSLTGSRRGTVNNTSLVHISIHFKGLYADRP